MNPKNGSTILDIIIKEVTLSNRLKEVHEGNPSYTHPQELLRDAAKMAERNSEKNCQNDDAKMKYQTRHGNIVGIVGQAGVGKTTYIKQLVQKFLNLKQKLRLMMNSTFST